MDHRENHPDPVPAAPCPICGKPATGSRRPFCSPRCADIDLGRWLKGVYTIPTEESPEDADGEGQTRSE
ncbi:MAG: hypothetical protein JWL84_2048 [Rhodospirillales bacterium]|jgi:endogenous inhibitor of DNA gyrase (YacG/DUF329 family)|nr:hypothetical protein [Rhodospirillales bacterium]